MTELPSRTWLSFDWRAAELYMLSLFSRDARLRQNLESSDVHRALMSDLHGVAPEDVRGDQRDLAKTAHYSLPYSAFDADTVIGLIQAEVPHLPRSEIVRVVDGLFDSYAGLYEWSRRALFDWYDSGGWVTYLCGARKRVSYPDYLKREEKAMRRSASGRLALNTYGQNSVGLLLKRVLSHVYRDPVLRAATSQHLPLFDAHYCLVETASLAEVIRRMWPAVTPVLRLDDFAVRMAVEWKGSLRSWGDVSPISDALVRDLTDGIDPHVVSWNTPGWVSPSQATLPPEVSEMNPFSF